MNKAIIATTFLALGVLTSPAATQAQVLFEDNLDSDAAWSLVHESDPTDNFVTFGFDYSTLGIPEAPNSQPGDAATSGVQMITNRDFGVTNSVAAFPTGMSFSGKFTYQFDLWMNVVGPYPGGGAASTEFGGGAVGFDNATSTPLSGGSLIVSGEGGFGTSDWRLYANDEFQLFTTHIDPETSVNDLYAPELPSADSNPNSYLGPIFPGQAAPAAQSNPDPPVNGLDQSGTLADGTLGMRWSTFKYTVDTDAGTALIQVTDSVSGLTADIGTFTLENTYVDRTTIDTKIITDLVGNVALTYRDINPSLIDYNPSEGIDLTPYSFGLFDNVIVEVYTPSEGLDGDFNDDGSVDGIDYAVWREGLGGEFDSTDFNTWLDNYGATAPGAVATPEPATVLSLLLATAGLAFATRRRP